MEDHDFISGGYFLFVLLTSFTLPKFGWTRKRKWQPKGLFDDVSLHCDSCLPDVRSQTFQVDNGLPRFSRASHSPVVWENWAQG